MTDLPPAAIATKKLTRGGLVNADITALMRARHSLLWISSPEEVRVERAIMEAAVPARFPVEVWCVARGHCSALGKVISADRRDPKAMLDYIGTADARCCYVLRDMHQWLKDPVILRTLRSLARELQVLPADKAKTIIILAPEMQIPSDLRGNVTAIEYPMPDRDEIGALLDDIIRNISDETVRANAAPNGVLEQAKDAALGLSADEAANCYMKSLVTARRIDPALVVQEKKRVIARDGLLEWIAPHPRGLEAIGGQENVKEWALLRKLAFSKNARAYGLPFPRAMFLTGISGCGKSLACKCIPTVWGVPLLRMDVGALMSKFVGESEQNTQKAFRLAETIAPCVLMMDEVEKAMAGSTGPQGDGGVSSRFLGAFLTWRQECTAPVFVMATANDPTSLPPEFLGRFEAMFFVDLPTGRDRVAIIQQAMKDHNRTISDRDAWIVSEATKGFTGREIAWLVPEALFTAFADRERAVTADDLVLAASKVVPLSETKADAMAEIRKWAKGRTRLAGMAPDAAAPKQTGRSIDLN